MASKSHISLANELKKIASHPLNQELQLQNIFIKFKQIFEPL
jgi:hypothetical protein